MKNRVLVEICGREFALIADESESYMKSIATEINKMIIESTYKSIRTSKSDAALLICLDLYDKNKKLSEANDNMQKEILTYVEEIDSLKKKLTRYERQRTDRSLQQKPEITETETEPKSEPDANTDTEPHDSGNIPQDNQNACEEPEYKTDTESETETAENIVDGNSDNTDVNYIESESENENKDIEMSDEPQEEREERKDTSVESLREKFNKLHKNMSK